MITKMKQRLLVHVFSFVIIYFCTFSSHGFVSGRTLKVAENGDYAGDRILHRAVRQILINGSTTAPPPAPVIASTPPHTTTQLPASQGNSSSCANCTSSGSSLPDIFKNNYGMVKRTLYVVVAITGIVVLYFVVKAVRLRRNKSKSRKYGVLSQGRDNMEMTPLDQDEDDEDTTVFEVNGRRK